MRVDSYEQQIFLWKRKSGKALVYGQPEIRFYYTGDTLSVRYPDLVEYKGKLLITETQKFIRGTIPLTKGFRTLSSLAKI